MINLKKQRELLINEKNNVIKRIKKITKDKERVNGPLSASFSEQAIQMENDEVIDQLDNIERELFYKINNAISRIDNNTYGFCLKCKNTISEKRLTTIPFAALCIPCQEN